MLDERGFHVGLLQTLINLIKYSHYIILYYLQLILFIQYMRPMFTIRLRYKMIIIIILLFLWYWELLSLCVTIFLVEGEELG